MVTKKDLIIAVLATFCLSVTLFTILPTRSAEYDPWVDLDGDGKIGITDIVQMTSIYGKTGDPSRNVNITDWPLPHPELRLVYNESIGYVPPNPNNYIYLTSVNTTGYESCTVHAKATGTWRTDQSPTQITILWFWNSYGITTEGYSFWLDTQRTSHPAYGCGYFPNLPIQSTQIDLYMTVSNYEANITSLAIAVYLHD
jgi:hypothetical protein